MPIKRLDMSVSEVVWSMDDEGVIRIENVPEGSFVALEKKALEQLLTEVSEAIMQAYSEREPLE